jgi:hypothetical protein
MRALQDVRMGSPQLQDIPAALNEGSLPLPLDCWRKQQ